MYYVMRASAPSLHRESTDSLIFPIIYIFACTGAHGATDVTGFGLLGHAKNLASAQKAAVSFKIHSLPGIYVH